MIQERYKMLYGGHLSLPLRENCSGPASMTATEMSVRRHTDPSIAQQIWDAIKTQESSVDLPKITKYLQRELGCTIDEAEIYVHNAVSDKLILENRKTSSKGLKTVSSVDSYKIPYQELIKPEYDGKDWYCIECHLAGTVQACRNCYRVFHSECLKRSSTKNTLKFFNDKSKVNTNTQGARSISVLDPVTAFKENRDIPDTFNMELVNPRMESSIIVENPNLSTMPSDLTFNGSYEESPVCSVCKSLEAEETCPLAQDHLNYLLGFILERIKSWLPANLIEKMDPKQQEEQWPVAELEWRANQLWFVQISMNDLHKKAACKEYTKLSEFQADVISIRHNVAIFHGFDSQEYAAAELMLRDCCHELSELCVCADCYRHSNEKLNSNWFCLPCKNPHRLVWAKQKGYPYWPAKVIRETNSVYDVRFFGGKYERSVLPKSSVKPIETPMDKFIVKNNAGFKKALDELRLHKSLLKDESAVEKLINEAKLRKGEKKKKGSGLMKSPTNKPFIQIKRDIYEFPDGHEKLLTETKPVKRKSLSPPNKNRKRQKSQGEATDAVPVPDDETTVIRNSSLRSTDTTVDQVTSSTEYIIGPEENTETPQMQELDQPYSDAIEKMRRKLEVTDDKTELITVAMDSMREEIDRIQAQHTEQSRKMTEDHAMQITETKRKQWCYYCQQDAIYHCCWNTAYCSPTCQQQHWQAEHKKVCRRKR